MDFVELQINLTNLVDQIPSPSSRNDSRWEILYKSQLLQVRGRLKPRMRTTTLQLF